MPNPDLCKQGINELLQKSRALPNNAMDPSTLVKVISQCALSSQNPLASEVSPQTGETNCTAELKALSNEPGNVSRRIRALSWCMSSAQFEQQRKRGMFSDTPYENTVYIAAIAMMNRNDEAAQNRRLKSQEMQLEVSIQSQKILKEMIMWYVKKEEAAREQRKNSCLFSRLFR